MKFAKALKHLERGEKVHRLGWNDPYWLRHGPNGFRWCWKTGAAPWSAPMKDLLADDWEVYGLEPAIPDPQPKVKDGSFDSAMEALDKDISVRRQSWRHDEYLAWVGSALLTHHGGQRWEHVFTADDTAATDWEYA